MLGIHDYALFVTTAVLLNLTPGPDTLYILGRSLAQGRRSGVASVLGISSGCLVHTLAAALGLSAVLTASAAAFTAVKILGAAYLIYLGIQMLRSKTALHAGLVPMKEASAWAIYRQGVVTNVLNPKVALFFLALLPQFVSKGSAHPILALLALGLTFVGTGTLWCLCLAFGAATLHQRLQRHPQVSLWIARLTGLTFLGLGVRLAWSDSP